MKRAVEMAETIAGNTGTTRFLLHPRVLPFLNNGKQFQYLPHEVLDATVDRRGMARIRRRRGRVRSGAWCFRYVKLTLSVEFIHTDDGAAHEGVHQHQPGLQGRRGVFCMVAWWAMAHPKNLPTPKIHVGCVCLYGCHGRDMDIYGYRVFGWMDKLDLDIYNREYSG